MVPGLTVVSIAEGTQRQGGQSNGNDGEGSRDSTPMMKSQPAHEEILTYVRCSGLLRADSNSFLPCVGAGGGKVPPPELLKGICSWRRIGWIRKLRNFFCDFSYLFCGEGTPQIEISLSDPVT